MYKYYAPCFTLALSILINQAVAEDRISFSKDIRQILTNHCFQCHGPDESNRAADLRLDSLQGATLLRDGVAAVVPGSPEKSLLIERITSGDESARMPPVELKKDLTKDQIALLKRWITEGAEYEDHWAFSPPKRPLLVSSSDNWGNNPIDDFIFQQMTQTVKQ